MVEALNQRPELTDAVMTAAELKSLFLFGISFKDDDGNEIPQSFFDFYIKSATEWIQNELSIMLLPTSIKDEAHDYYMHDMMNFGALRLFKRPLRSVSRYRFETSSNSNVLDFDTKWFRPEYNAGTIHLLPDSATVTNFLSANGYSTFLRNDFLPFSIFVDYECGFAAGKIPANILEVVGMRASLGALNITGDLLGGAGIASKSLSVDGLSESISTTSSATNAGYGARVIQYTKQIAEQMATLHGIYNGIQMVIA